MQTSEALASLVADLAGMVQYGRGCRDACWRLPASGQGAIDLGVIERIRGVIRLQDLTNELRPVPGHVQHRNHAGVVPGHGVEHAPRGAAPHGWGEGTLRSGYPGTIWLRVSTMRAQVAVRSAARSAKGATSAMRVIAASSPASGWANGLSALARRCAVAAAFPRG